MIEIIKEYVKMPPLSERRYQLYSLPDFKWFVIDTRNNITRYKGSFQMCAIVSHNLNKKFYIYENNVATD